ncbi:hypothetical protein P170DRAFT_474636 [Aspergillus steynii IBT 23096]|uniref:CoA-dependent acyltransferase n=1 Tax=Aspergillus steynii IBT 23096 TaxID=1392250 RepID=A0A2I2GDW2_9EURO|nr:uncharacterized protein P170DRAFT_474636 [Aspergillus steynii IBT 23096]PLB51089.1 hypothetical protein P170DRAFT_474636 [Aspergillus steynii IBT 23096]
MTSSRPPSSWLQVDETRYVRPLDALETLLSSVYINPLHPGFRTQDIVTSIRIRTSMSNGMLLQHARRAWEQMRHLHPMIAAEYDEKQQQYVYQSPISRREVEEWLEQSFIVDSGCFHHPARGHDYGRVPASDRPVLYYFQGEGRFVLRCPHIHADGTATGILLKDFLSELTTPRELEAGAFGDEIRNLPPGAIEAARIQVPSVTTEDTRLSSREMHIPTSGETLSPKPGRLQVLAFSETGTATILQRGRQTGLGLTALVHTALLKACKAMTRADSPPQDTHTSLTGFNLRDRCDPSLPDAIGARAFAPRASMWPYQVRVGDYWETAQALKVEYRSLAQSKDRILEASVPCLRKFLPAWLEKEPPFFASFIGDLSLLFGRSSGSLQVEEAWITLIPMTAMMYLVVQTFRGRLAVRLSYNEAYWRDEQVAEFLGRVKGELDRHVLTEGAVGVYRANGQTL